MKLTDLRQAETSKEEMSYLKGGDGSENGPLCRGCSCGCDCSSSNGLTSSENSGNNQRANRNNGDASWWIDQAMSFATL